MCHLDASKWQFLRCSQLEKATGRLFKILGSFFKIISIKYPPSRLDKKLNFMERDSIKMYITFCKVLECGFWGRGSRPAKRSRRDAKGRCYNLYIYIYIYIYIYYASSAAFSSFQVLSIFVVSEQFFQVFFEKSAGRLFKGLVSCSTWQLEKVAGGFFKRLGSFFKMNVVDASEWPFLGCSLLPLGSSPQMAFDCSQTITSKQADKQDPQTLSLYCRVWGNCCTVK